ncbi:hypothetical protein MHL31_13000 [Lutibacter sp. A80]|uniref:VOC family protein n=1 Tax=Lutibacter sp. A80 TaxID=2918453 RepID=UPI001F068F54|nr:VOC family protein [Lutibacter sp. A80]UMB59988.1 hypothetical protein MHL31_13000 [Lutibacter sp. A80]
MRNNKKINTPKIDYVGKIVIEAKNPKVLAEWYTNKFGLIIELEYYGEFHGGFTSNNRNLYIEIVPTTADEAQSNISLTFHVDDFKGYLHNLKTKGIIPITTDFTHEGEFASFKDPENNKIAIMGTLT